MKKSVRVKEISADQSAFLTCCQIPTLFVLVPVLLYLFCYLSVTWINFFSRLKVSFYYATPGSFRTHISLWKQPNNATADLQLHVRRRLTFNLLTMNIILMILVLRFVLLRRASLCCWSRYTELDLHITSSLILWPTAWFAWNTFSRCTCVSFTQLASCVKVCGI